MDGLICRGEVRGDNDEAFWQLLVDLTPERFDNFKNVPFVVRPYRVPEGIEALSSRPLYLLRSELLVGEPSERVPEFCSRSAGAAMASATRRVRASSIGAAAEGASAVRAGDAPASHRRQVPDRDFKTGRAYGRRRETGSSRSVSQTS